MKKIYTLSLLFVSLNAISQQSIFEFPKEINTTKTASHVNIPGTHIFIIPQGHFKINGTYIPGLYDSTNNSTFIAAYENKDNAYKYLHNVEYSESQYYQIVYQGDLKINRYPAKIALRKVDSTTIMGTLLFGDSSFVVKISIIIQAKDSLITKNLFASLQTIYYEKDSKIDRFANTVFTVDDSKSLYKFMRKKDPSYIFSKNGDKVNIDSGYDSYISVSQIPDDIATSDEVVDDFLDGITDSTFLGKFFIKNPEVTKKKVIVNGLACYEMKIFGEYKGRRILIYLQTFTINNMTVVFQGMTYSDFENFISEFQKLSNTIKKK